MARQLTSVYDSTLNVQGFPYKASGTYTYDPNGNLLIDPYQGITMTYDVLNRTDSTKINGTTYITYTYDASGSLIRKKAYNSGALTQTDYIDGFVYTGNGTTQTLEYAPMPEGRLLGTALTQEFVITDPQGNARVAFQNVSGAAKVTQENSYYGYGLIMPGSLVGYSSPPNKNLYNGGSEWQNDTKVVNAGVPDYYQTFYRNYDPALARFVAVDPEAEGAESMDDYHYAGDNPIVYNDPTGDMVNVKTNQPILQGEINDPAIENDGGGSSGSANPTDATGTNSDSNWMNDGAFDDEGAGIDPKTGTTWKGGLSFSSDGGAAGRAFWLPAVIAGGALNNVSASTLAPILANIPAFGGGQYGAAYGQDLGTSLRQVEIAYRQTGYVKDGQAYVNGIWSIEDVYDPTAANEGIDPTDLPGLRQFIAIAVGASGTGRNKLEIQAAASVMIDRMNQAGTSLHDPNWLKKISYSGNTAIDFTETNGGNYDYNSIMASTSPLSTSNNKGIQYAYAAAFGNWSVDISNSIGYPDTGLYFFNQTSTLTNSTYGAHGAGYCITAQYGGSTFYRPQ